MSTNNDTLHGYLEIAKDEEDKLEPSEVSESSLLKCISEYQDWLATKLSSDGYVVQSEAKNKLTEIIK